MMMTMDWPLVRGEQPRSLVRFGRWISFGMRYAVAPSVILLGCLLRPAPALADDVGKGSEVAGALLPLSVLQLPDSIDLAIVVDVDQYRMYEVRRVAGQLAASANYYVAIGKAGAGKTFEGDEKTPLGVYTIESHIPGSRLPEIYGVGALPMDYPSAWDLYRGRTGSGIWIHGTNKSDDELLPRSSRGCLTLRNDDFERLNQVVSVGDTPVIVTQSIDWRTADEIRALRTQLLDRVEQWRRDWESLDTERYLQHYDESFRSGSMDIDRWRAHKRRVNAAKSEIRVRLEDIGIFGYPSEEGLFAVRYTQLYSSDNFNGKRQKWQYWRKTGEGWKIVVEAS